MLEFSFFLSWCFHQCHLREGEEEQIEQSGEQIEQSGEQIEQSGEEEEQILQGSGVLEPLAQ